MKSGSFMRAVVFLLIIGTSLVLAINANDSTLFKPAILIILSALLLTSWIMVALNQDKFTISLTPIHLALTVFVIISALSLTLATNFSLGLEGLVLLICCSIIFFAVSAIPKNDIEPSVIMAVTITGSLACAVALGQNFLTFSSFKLLMSGERQTISTLGNSMYFGGFLALLIPLVAGQALIKRKSPATFVLFVAFGLIMVFLLIKTESRSAWIAALVSLLTFGLLSIKTPRARWTALALFVGAVFALSIPFHEIFYRRVSDLLESGPSSSIPRRFFFYEGAWNAFLHSPLIGNGIGNFVVFLPRFRSPEYWMAQSEDIVPHAHNEFLEILSETGILGLLAFTTLLIVYFVSWKRTLKSARGSERMLIVSYGCSILAVLIDNLASLNLRTVPVSLMFWVVIGLSHHHFDFKRYVISITPYTWLRKFQFAAPVFFIVMIWWYIPHLISTFQADRSFLQGNLLRWKNNEVGSTQHFREAITRDPLHAEARLCLAANLLQSARFGEAYRHMDTLLWLYPYYPKARLIRAICAFELGDIVNAQHEIADELSIENSPQALSSALRFESKLGDRDRQYSYVKLLLRNSIKSGISTYTIEGIHALSDFCSDERHRSECGEILGAMAKRFHADVHLLAEIGECYERIGMFTEARDVVDQAFSLNSPQIEITEQLKRLLGKLRGIDSVAGR